MDAWIDTYHAVKSLTRDDTFVFLTDSAVGLKEEDNLRHLVSNMGSDVPRSSIAPFLTTKHPLEYCLAYADRAYQHGFESLVVLGGDKSVGPPRCVEHAWQLREHIRRHRPDLTLGGWANPHADAATQVGLPAGRPRQRGVLPDADRVASQPRRRSSASSRKPIGGAWRCRGCSASSTTARPMPKTLDALSGFLPVPVEELTREFGERRDAPTRSARARFASCAPPASATSTSATCRSARRRRRSSASCRWSAPG